MLRIEVSEAGHGALPAIDVDEPAFVIGSSPAARVRLPAAVAAPEHVWVEGGRWRGAVKVDGVARDAGELGDGVTLELGDYRVRIAPAPAGTTSSPPQRTESLARELMRGLLGASAAPTLEIERGPEPGIRRTLAPPESVLRIGRGEEADWVVLDTDLSRVHAEVRRGWDGVRILDRGSKNGTRVDGVAVGPQGAALRDGALVELGKVHVRFRDPAERELAAAPMSTPTTRPRPSPSPSPSPNPNPNPSPSPSPSPDPSSSPHPSAWPFYVPLAICVLALAGMVWLLAG
jgi:hypothetical protein